MTMSSVILKNNYISTVSVNGADIVAKVTLELYSGKTYSTKKHGINLKAPTDALESNTTKFQASLNGHYRPAPAV